MKAPAGVGKYNKHKAMKPLKTKIIKLLAILAAAGTVTITGGCDALLDDGYMNVGVGGGGVNIGGGVTLPLGYYDSYNGWGWNGYNGIWNGWNGYFGPSYWPGPAPRPTGKPNLPPPGGGNRPTPPIINIGGGGGNTGPGGAPRPGNNGRPGFSGLSQAYDPPVTNSEATLVK